MENGVLMQYFEWNLPNDGQLWRRLRDDAEHLSGMGVTAVWIPPAYKAETQNNNGYGPYDLYDFGEFDQKGTVRTKFGTREELQEMIEKLHEHSISVYLDVVLNHKAGGDYTEDFMVVEVAQDDRNYSMGDPREITGWTGFAFEGRGDKYSDFKWHWYHFSGLDYEEREKRTGVFRILGDGKSWSEGVDHENGNYDYLMCNDIDLDHPEVVDELHRWGVWVAREFGFDGMRLDAVKHMRDVFIAEFIKTIRAEQGDEFYAVGEYWVDDVDALVGYVAAVARRVNLFDVPLHYNMHRASIAGKDYDLRDILKNTLVEREPELAVTFVDNHDSQHGSSLESCVDDWFKPLAYGLIFLMKHGYPCLFYGDYYGIGENPPPHVKIIDILLDARRRYAYGGQVDYFDHPSTVGFVRTGDADHQGLVFLMSNDEPGAKMMHIGSGHAGEEWHEITGSVSDIVVIGDDGNGWFSVNGRNIAVWVKK